MGGPKIEEFYHGRGCSAGRPCFLWKRKRKCSTMDAERTKMKVCILHHFENTISIRGGNLCTTIGRLVLNTFSRCFDRLCHFSII